MNITNIAIGDKRIDISYEKKLNIAKDGESEEILYSSPELPTAEFVKAVDSFTGALLKEFGVKPKDNRFGLKALKLVYTDNTGDVTDIKAKITYSARSGVADLAAEPTYSFMVNNPCSPGEKMLRELLNEAENYINGDRAQGTLPLLEGKGQ